MNKYEKTVVTLLTAQLEVMRDIAAGRSPKAPAAKAAPKKKPVKKAAKRR